MSEDLVAGDATSSLLDLAEGFLALPRRLCGSSFFNSLRADERYVVVTMLLRAQWAPGEFFFGGRRFELAPGQFVDAEEALARAAGSTRKVVRTVYRKLEAAGLVTRARVHPAGQCPSVTTITGYDRISLRRETPGPRADPPAGHDGAKNGPANGPHPTRGNQVKPGNPLSPSSPSVRRSERSASPGGFAPEPASAPEEFTGRSENFS